MKEQEISLITAQLAKLKGFDWECKTVLRPNSEIWELNYFEGDGGKIKNSRIDPVYEDYLCTIPTQSLLQKWLRDVHNIFVTTSINPYFQDSLVGYYAQVKSLSSTNQGERLLDGFTIFLKTEDSLEEGLFEALKLINDKS